MRFVIASPPYRSTSAGIRVLYELQKLFIRFGEDSIIINVPFQLEKTDVLVVPECIQASQFNPQFIVRYYLNTPRSNIDYSKDDCAIKFNSFEKVGVDATPIKIRCIEPWFKPLGLPRQFAAAYIGKCSRPVRIPEGVYVITPDWPPTRNDVADFLNRCTKLYMYDDKSMIAEEARLCGCQVVYMDENDNETPYPYYDWDDNTMDTLKTFIETVKEKHYAKVLSGKTDY